MSPMTKKGLATSGLALAAAHTAMLAPLAPAFAAGEVNAVANPAGQALGDVHGDAQSLHIKPVTAKDGSALYEMTGYVALVRSAAEVSEFMLVSDMGVCPWCGEAGHGVALEVQLAGPTVDLEDGQRITVRGVLDGDLATEPSLMMDAQVL
ncbi:MAG: hypothetical protein AAGI03_16080 [Pseudomonadota bacterium]